MRDSYRLNFPFPIEGELREGQIFSILYQVYKNDISGVLVVKTDTFKKKMYIRDKKIIFASSDLKTDNFSEFLLNKQLITPEINNSAGRYMFENKKRFGRALIELGYFTYDQIWSWVPAHLNSIVYSFFCTKYGIYNIMEESEEDIDVENIVLDLDILGVIVEGMRRFKSEAFLKKNFESIDNLYIYYPNIRLISELDLKPYEIHVFDLVKRESSLEKILKWSELLESDTLRLLYLLLVLEIISTRKYEISSPRETFEGTGNTSTLRPCSFASFEEALKYYNAKYEFIYKVMLKEIGPISLSILLKSIEDILENLPSYFQKIHLNPDGTINEEIILKTLWYHDFDQHSGDFLRGLEEILYTEVFSVKKHLGVESEQQVLKWIKAIGNELR